MFNQALILAGGKSERMGRDKTLIKFGKSPTMTHFLYDKLSEIFADVKVSAKEQKFTPPLSILTDFSDEFSPLVALSNLSKFNEPVFVINADMPLISRYTIAELFDKYFQNNVEICLASSGGRVHYLCGVFSPKVGESAKKMLENGERKVGEILHFHSHEIVVFDDNDEFANLNTPKDLTKIDFKEI